MKNVGYESRREVPSPCTTVGYRPESEDVKHVEIDDVALEALLDGIDVEDAATPPRTRTH